MKKIMLGMVLSILVLVICSASIFPPALPSSFWGTVSGIPAGGQIYVSAGGIPLATASVQDYNGTLYYAVDVCNGVEGSALQFRYNGGLVGNGVYHTGTNQHVDLAVAVENRIKPGVKHGR